MRGQNLARVVGVGLTPPGKARQPATRLMRAALETALGDGGLSMRQLDGLVAVPSLAEPHFMEAHYLATQVGLLPRRDALVRTIDTGGAGPISGLLEARRMIRSEGCKVVAVVAGDAVSSMPTDRFLERADAGCQDPEGSLPSPVIPSGYDRVARWQLQRYPATKREHLAMVSVLMSRQGVRHPEALASRRLELQEVLDSPPIAPGGVTNLLECARRADGGAAVIVASSHFLDSIGVPRAQQGPVLAGGGEASGPLYPPPIIDEEMFSAEAAVQHALEEAQLATEDIDFFGLYDCFPICFLRALEAVGLAAKGQGGPYIERLYRATAEPDYSPSAFPINSHGGLLGFGAPWEVPAMYNTIEAVRQLRGAAAGRQVEGARRALVYGNGGIFSASAVAVLSSVS